MSSSDDRGGGNMGKTVIILDDAGDAERFA
jgi:hypothetical protein